MDDGLITAVVVYITLVTTLVLGVFYMLLTDPYWSINSKWSNKPK